MILATYRLHFSICWFFLLRERLFLYFTNWLWTKSNTNLIVRFHPLLYYGLLISLFLVFFVGVCQLMYNTILAIIITNVVWIQRSIHLRMKKNVFHMYRIRMHKNQRQTILLPKFCSFLFPCMQRSCAPSYVFDLVASRGFVCLFIYLFVVFFVFQFNFLRVCGACTVLTAAPISFRIACLSDYGEFM